jgi:hypothetical protein
VSWLCLWWRSFNGLSNLLLLRYLHGVKDDLLTSRRRGIVCLIEGIPMPLGDCLLNVGAKLEPSLTSERTNFSRSTFATTSLQSETLLISQCGQMGLSSIVGERRPPLLRERYLACTRFRRHWCENGTGGRSSLRPCASGEGLGWPSPYYF